MSFTWDDLNAALVETEGDVAAAAEMLAGPRARKPLKYKLSENFEFYNIIDYYIVFYLLEADGTLVDLKRSGINTVKDSKKLHANISQLRDFYTQGHDPMHTRIANRKVAMSKIVAEDATTRSKLYQHMTDNGIALQIEQAIGPPRSPFSTSSPLPPSSSKSATRSSKSGKKDKKKKKKSSKSRNIFGESDRSQSAQRPQPENELLDYEVLTTLAIDVKAYIEQEHAMNMRRRREGKIPLDYDNMLKRMQSEFSQYDKSAMKAYYDKVLKEESEGAFWAVNAIQERANTRIDKPSTNTEIQRTKDIDYLVKRYPQFSRDDIESYYNDLIESGSEQTFGMISDDDDESQLSGELSGDFINDDPTRGDFDILPGQYPQQQPQTFPQRRGGLSIEYFTLESGKTIQVISNMDTGDIVSVIVVQATVLVFQQPSQTAPTPSGLQDLPPIEPIPSDELIPSDQITRRSRIEPIFKSEL